MAKNQIKMKKVAFTNKLLPGEPTQYKLAMVTPVVVTRDKFIQNVCDHTGLNKHIVRSVIDSIEECAGDYMEIGNAVQIGDEFGTLKPTVKVKAVNTSDECTADTVLSIGMKFIPTGNMRTRLSQVGFTVKGTSDGSDVEDSEVETDNPTGDSNGSGNSNGSGDGGSGDSNGSGEQNGGNNSGEQNGGNGDSGEQNGDEGGTYRITYKFADDTEDDSEYAVGATISYPANSTGYKWPDSKPDVMPAQNVTVTEELIGNP